MKVHRYSSGSTRVRAELVRREVLDALSTLPAAVRATEPLQQEHIIRSLHRGLLWAGSVPFPPHLARVWLLHYLEPLLATIGSEEVILDVDGSLPTEEPPT